MNEWGLAPGPGVPLSPARSGGNKHGLGAEAGYQMRPLVRRALCPATLQNIQQVSTTT